MANENRQAEQPTTKDEPASRRGAARKTASSRSSTAAAKNRVTPSEIAAKAIRQLVQLTGRQPEGVTGLERKDEGWLVVVDVLELHRVPETTDVLASYEVEVDEHGELRGYRRLQRYVRGSAGEGRG